MCYFKLCVGELRRAVIKSTIDGRTDVLHSTTLILFVGVVTLAVKQTGNDEGRTELERFRKAEENVGRFFPKR